MTIFTINKNRLYSFKYIELYGNPMVLNFKNKRFTNTTGVSLYQK